ncbi:hypothetical protein K9M42_00070 [Patescibacteria group bacterium]|nr:hypothetical protein [Patescibacteria group bacterium]
METNKELAFIGHGRLIFVGWKNRPWILKMKENVIDLYPIIKDFLFSLDGKSVSQNLQKDKYILFVNKKNNFQFKYLSGLFEKTNNINFFNTENYINNILTWLSGRMINIKAVRGSYITIIADRTEKVHGLYLTDGNSCKITEDVAIKVCKYKTNNTCIFFSTSKDDFYCLKFTGYMACILLNRLPITEENKKIIGRCELLGKKIGEINTI